MDGIEIIPVEMQLEELEMRWAKLVKKLLEIDEKMEADKEAA